MRRLSLTSILESLDLDTGLSIRDILDHGYSRKIMRIIRYVKELEEDGKLHKYGFKSSTPFAHGQAGAIFDSLDDGFVIKASFDDNDFENARDLKKLGHPHVANIKSVRTMKVPQEEPKQAKEQFMTLIQVEKLNQFEDLSDFVNDLMYPLIDELNVEEAQARDLRQEKLSRKMTRKILDRYRSDKDSMSPQERKICRNLLRFMKDMHKSGYHFQDRQSSQFLIDKKGRIKLVDFGSMRKNIKKV